MIEYIPYPKMLYHPMTGIGTIVANEDAHAAKLAEWDAECAPVDPEPVEAAPVETVPVVLPRRRGRPRKS